MMFGVMDLKYSNLDGVTAALGIRAANDKTMSVQVTVGMRVFVCDNMAFSSDGIALRKKHAAGLRLDREMVRAVDIFAGRYLTMEQQVQHAQQRMLTDDQAKAMMFDAFAERLVPQRLLPDVAKHYFEPPHPEFEPRNVWSLHNAFTEAFKQMEAMPAHRANMRVSRILGITGTEAKQ